MTYYIRDVEDYVDDFTTIAGLEELRKYATQRKMYHLLGFLDKGAALITEALMNEVKEAKPASKDLRETFEGLIDILERCELVAIIQDGVND